MQDDEESTGAAAPADMKRRWREQQDDVLFPDEVCPLSQCAQEPSVCCYNPSECDMAMPCVSCPTYPGQTAGDAPFAEQTHDNPAQQSGPGLFIL